MTIELENGRKIDVSHVYYFEVVRKTLIAYFPENFETYTLFLEGDTFNYGFSIDKTKYGQYVVSCIGKALSPNGTLIPEGLVYPTEKNLNKAVKNLQGYINSLVHSFVVMR